MSAPSEKRLRVAIVGGGMAGLALALGLKPHSHLDVAVYEAAHKFSEIGAGVAFGPNSQRALALIHPDADHAFQKLATKNAWPEKKNLFFEYVVGMGPDAGKSIASPHNETGQTSVHRAKFLDEFVKMLPEGVAHFGKRLEELEERQDGKVVMRFRDGTQEEADCVIGADGIHSVVRSYLLGKDHPAVNARFTNCVAYRGLIPMGAAVEALGEQYAQNSSIWAGHGAAVMVYPIDHGETLNIVAIDGDCKDWEGPWVQHVEYAKIEKRFEGWSENVKKMVKLLDSPDTMAWSMWEHPTAPTFCGGNVVMIGDAAHASTPFQGQGAGQGFEDAFVLGSLLAQVDDSSKISAAFRAYDRIRRPRSTRVCTTSRETGEMCFFRHPSVGDDLKAFKENIDWRMDWMWHRDVAGERNEAMLIFQKLLEGKEIYPYET